MKKFLVIAAVIAFTAGSASAGLLETFGIGAKETAQSKAVAARVDSPFAVYYNPAGLVNITRPTLTAGFVAYDAQVATDSMELIATEDKGGYKKGDTIEGWTKGSETDRDTLIIPNMGYAMPLTEKLSLGVAAYSPYGLHIYADNDPYKNPLSSYAWESLYVRAVVTPTLAYKVNDKLSFGFGVSLGRSVSDAGKTHRYNPFGMAAAGKEMAAGTNGRLAGAIKAVTGHTAETSAQIAKEVSYNAVLSTDSKNGTFNRLQLESEDDFNISWNAGVMYKPSDKISLGFTYRSRAAGDFAGDAFFRSKKIGTVKMDFDHPEQVQGGVAYKVNDRLTLEFDLTWTRWSINERQVEKITINDLSSILADGAKSIAEGIDKSQYLSAPQKMALKTALASQPMEKPSKAPVMIAYHDRDWEDTFQYQLGAEFLMTEKLCLRGGIIYDPTPVPDKTFDQGWPDTDRTVFNLGAGYKITDKWEIDGVFQFIKSTSPRDINGNSNELNHAFNKDHTAGLNAPNVEVHVDENTGTLWGLGFNVTYKF